MKYHYSVFRLEVYRLDDFLNTLENCANGNYEIISILKLDKNSINDTVGVVVRFSLLEAEFNEEEIKKKLGF